MFEQNHRSGLRRHFRALLLMGIIWAGMLLPAAASELGDIIHSDMERIRSGERLVVDGAGLVMTNTLPRFYESRNFEPAWQNTQTVEELLNSIDDIANDGLRPSDYHITTLRKMYGELRQGRLNATQTARFDLLCSDALLLMAHHLAFGRVPQGLMHTAWNFAQPVSRDDFLPYVQDGLARKGVAGMLRQLLPQHPDYVRLRDAMSRNRSDSSQRNNKMRVNLERMRWFLRNVPKQYILVDVAGYMAYLMKDGHVLWSSRVQVGRPQRQTPEQCRLQG